MGIEERAAVAVAQFTLLSRARKVRPNATNKREEYAHAGDEAVLRGEMVVLALETPQRPHAASGLAMPVAQRNIGLIVLMKGWSSTRSGFWLMVQHMR
jgi:hypothetical protein